MVDFGIADAYVQKLGPNDRGSSKYYFQLDETKLNQINLLHNSLENIQII